MMDSSNQITVAVQLPQSLTQQGRWLLPQTRIDLQGWYERFPTAIKFHEAFSADSWAAIIGKPSCAYSCFTPTLSHISALYGDNVAIEWVERQVLAIWFMTVAKDPAISNQAKVWSSMFASEAQSRTVGEVRLFFARCAIGKYYIGREFDITKLGAAWEKFKEEWRIECNQYEYEKAKNEQERKDSYMQTHCYDYAEHCRRTGKTPNQEYLDMIGNKDSTTRNNSSAKIGEVAVDDKEAFAEKKRKFFEAYNNQSNGQ